MAIQFNTFFVDCPASTGNANFAHGLTSPDTDNFALVAIPCVSTTENVEDIDSGLMNFGAGFSARKNAGTIQDHAFVAGMDFNTVDEGSQENTGASFLQVDRDGATTLHHAEGTVDSINATNLVINFTAVESGVRWLVMLWTGVEAEIVSNTFPATSAGTVNVTHSLDDAPEMAFCLTRWDDASGGHAPDGGMCLGVAVAKGGTPPVIQPNQYCMGIFQDWSQNDAVTIQRHNPCIAIMSDETNQWRASIDEWTTAHVKVEREDALGLGTHRFTMLLISRSGGDWKTDFDAWENANNVASDTRTIGGLTDINLGIIIFGIGTDGFFDPATETPASAQSWGAKSIVSGNEGCVSSSFSDTKSGGAWTDNYGLKLDTDADDVAEVLANFSRNGTTLNQLDIDYPVVGKRGSNPTYYDYICMEVSNTVVQQSVAGTITPAGALSTALTIAQTVAGTITPAGALSTNVLAVISQSVAGVISSITGALSTHTVKPQTVSGGITPAGALTKTVKKTVAGAISSIAGTVSTIETFLLRLGIDDGDATLEDGVIKYLVQMSSTDIPDALPSDNTLVQRGLIAPPRIEKRTSTAKGGVSGLSTIRFEMDNLAQQWNARNFDNLFVRVHRIIGSGVSEFYGVVTQWAKDKTIPILAEDREATVFNELLPKREIDETLFVDVIDKTVGKAIQVVHNRARNIPLPIIGIDDANREYDYLLSEGSGKHGNFADVFTVYKEESALVEITGVVQGGSNTTQIVLEAADNRDAGYYSYFWIEIFSDAGLTTLIDIKYVSSHTSNGSSSTVVLDSAYAGGGTHYRLREWRFYDGSQVSPYPGIAFIRLKKQLGEGDRFDNLYADVDGLPADNVVREIEDWLTNATWGLGLTINQASFDTVAGNAQISNIKTEWAVLDKTDAGDLIESLLEIYNMRLEKRADELHLFAEESKTVAGVFGYGDEFYNNILSVDGGLRSINVRDRVKDLKVHYRPNYRETNTFLNNQTASVNASGIDIEEFLPMFYEHEDANRWLYFRQKKLQANVSQLTITVGEEGKSITVGDRITIKIPHLGIDADFFVERVRKEFIRYQFECILYDDTTYTWSQIGALPAPPSTGIPTDFTSTIPSDISGLSVTGGLDTLEAGDRMGFLDISWTQPNDGNYLDAEILIKENGQPFTSYVSKGHFSSGTRLTGLSPVQAYDVLVRSRNQHGLYAVGIEDLSTTTGSGATAPSTPSTPTSVASGRIVTFYASPPTSTFPLRDFDWEIDFISGGTDYSVERHGLTVTVEVAGTSNFSVRARFRATNIYGQQSAYSSYSTTRSNETWQQGHMGSGSIGGDQIQSGAVTSLKIGDLQVTTGKIDDLDVTNAKIGNLQVDSDKRIDTLGSTFSYAGNPFTVNANTKTSSTFTIVHNLNEDVIGVIRMSFNTATTDGITDSCYLTLNSTTSIALRWEVANTGNVGNISNVNVDGEIYYW